LGGLSRSPLTLILSPDGGEETVRWIVCSRGSADRRGALFLSPSEGERIKVRGGSLRQFAQDCVKDTAEIFTQRVVPKPNHFNVQAGENSVPLPVSGFAVGMSMFPTVQFDRQAGFSAIEVQVEWTYRMLPAEFVSSELAISQPAPKKFFGPGRFLAKASDALCS